MINVVSANADLSSVEKSEKQFSSQIKPLLTKYCLDCHTGEEAEAGLSLDKYTTRSSILKHREAWEKIVQRIQIQSMPPKDADTQPTDKEREAILAWFDDTLYGIDCSGDVNPGRVTIRRLNRNEYNNTIRDLVGIDFQPAKNFPSDDVGYGFDNIGDVLSLPPLLMEKYLDASEQIAQKAIFANTPDSYPWKSISEKQLQKKGAVTIRKSGVGFHSRGTLAGLINLKQAGKYEIRIKAGQTPAGKDPAKMKVELDGKLLRTFDVKADRSAPGTYLMPRAVALSKGKHVLTVTFLNDFFDPKGPPKKRDRNLYVNEIAYRGPLGLLPTDLPASHKKIITCNPGSGRSVQYCTEKIFKQFAERAFRRPVSRQELKPIVELVNATVKSGRTFEQGIQVGIQAILVSPHFLFRIEGIQNTVQSRSNGVQKVNQYEIASRLSYFLWSSMPDETLFELAAQGRLDNPRTLQVQVKRMLNDPKSSAFVKNFAGQWLNLRNLEDLSPDPKKFRGFNSQLKNDMRRETEEFFSYIMKEDRSVIEFINADYTFMNERLAKFYGNNRVKGESFQKVNLDKTKRAGLITQASILTLTSNPGRTSPVKRGKWIMENILGTPPPAPPPNVPELEESASAKPNATLREQLAIHRKIAGCAACHDLMDPLGLGFENFNAVGSWREKEGRKKIDSSGLLPDGQTFNGPIELITILEKQKQGFCRSLTEKMLTYAIGRGIEFYDKCAIDEITTNFTAKGYRFSALVTEIVLSDPFLKRQRGPRND
ncbi:MAG: DUF1592 domain-containing protein [Planctomycetes bacterium]|nr:DUF1592 domain-containing protein [Planctomycetota bacterium]MCH9726084.1 DUF1592 domain-containing protein [Planctomycetota bacterium]MCH9777236.1 DUF1592 domain-containing protein [Planctomycetota bacterium]MDF1744459.1 DUF1592 domain-containing protein [Gimesia sp.]